MKKSENEVSGDENWICLLQEKHKSANKDMKNWFQIRDLSEISRGEGGGGNRGRATTF